MQTHFQSFILTMGPASVLVDSTNKRLSESLGIAGRKQGGKWDAHLPFMGDANRHQQLISLLSSYGATQQVFLLTLSPFSSICCNLPSIKALSCFSFPPSVHWVAFPLPICKGVAKDCCCPLWLWGGTLCPAAGRWSRRGAQTLWLPQKSFHSSWGGGMTGKHLFYRSQVPVELLCVYRWA